MSREVEKTYYEFLSHAKASSLISEDELQAILEASTMPQNEKLIGTAEALDAYDYLEMAYNANSPKKAAEYAQKALELAPDLLEAELLLVSLHAKINGAYQAELEALLKKGEQQLASMGITREEDAGDYYLLHETRPYLEAYNLYIDLLISEGKLRKAVEACKDVLYLNADDNMGVRYTLMALYALLEEKDLGEALYNRYPEESSSMLLPLIALYYRLDDPAKAAEWLKVLAGHIKGIKKALKELLRMDESDFYALSHIPYYSPDTTEELQLAYINCTYLYETMPDFIPWMIANLPQKRAAKKGTAQV